MIPYDVDPSLHAEQREPQFDDGFSPPTGNLPPSPRQGSEPSTVTTSGEPVLRDKSDF